MSEARLKILANVSRALAEVVTHYDQLVATITRVATEYLVDSANLFLVTEDGKWLELVSLHCRDAKLDAAIRALHRTNRYAVGPDSTIGRVAMSGETMFLPITSKEQLKQLISPAARAIAEDFSVSSLLNVPLTARGKVIGVLTFLRHGELGQPMEDADRQLAQDLADRAALAIDNARLYRDLERRVAERTTELSELNKELESFTYSVSHDLRAPLRAIDGFARILEEDHGAALDADAIRVINVIRKNALRMGQLIEDLLAFSRLGRMTVHKDPVAMTALARQAADDALAAEPRRRIELAIDELPPCRGDRELLRQVWANVIGNAVKYTRPREVATIRVTGAVAGDEVIYRVSDNGIGFEMAYVHKLFGVFQRLCAQTEFEGTGVGLALVHRIVVRHGGRVSAQGEPDRGATIEVALPRGEAT